MANCGICSTELKNGVFNKNKPSFNMGVLNDGNELCSKCFSLIDPKMSLKLKNYSLTDIKNYLAKKEIDKNERDSKFEIIVNDIKKLNSKVDILSKGKKEINELPEILTSDEKIDNILWGINLKKGPGILVSTNYRLIFISAGSIVNIEDYPLDKISSIECSTLILFGEIKIHTNSNVSKIENIEKESAKEFTQFVRDKIFKSTSNTESNIIDQLEKLAKLKENGILTEEEFNEQKKKLLNN